MKNRIALVAFIFSMISINVFAQNFEEVFNILNYDYPGGPQLRVFPKGNDSVKIYQNKNSKNILEYYESDKIVTYSINTFSQFVDVAYQHGLNDMVVETPTWFSKSLDTTVVLKFGQKRKILANGIDLNFSSRFFRDITCVTGDSKDLQLIYNKTQHAIFVLDPHSNVEQVPKLVNTLKRLIDENPKQKFALLVEGYFEGNDRNIRLDTILSQISKDAPLEYQVYQMTSHFLIDAATAYRILYNKNIQALAIDDPELIRQQIPFYVKATFKNNDTSSQSKLFDDGDYSSDNIESQNAFFYGKRDSTMSFYINKFLRDNSDVIPIIFIGAVHAKGLIERLPQNVNYSFLAVNIYEGEPHDEFSNAYYLDKRKEFLRTIANGQLKCVVAPLAGEGFLYGAFLESVSKIWKQDRIKLNSLPEGISLAQKVNPAFYKSSMKISRSELPEKYKDAFAHIEIDEDDISKELDQYKNVDFFDEKYTRDEGISNYLKNVRLQSIDYGEALHISYYTDDNDRLFYSIAIKNPENGKIEYYLFDHKPDCLFKQGILNHNGCTYIFKLKTNQISVC